MRKLAWLPTPAFAHRLDEYLEAATIGVARGRVQRRLRLVAGVIAAPKVLAIIDTDGDSVISGVEQRAYGEKARRDLSLEIDGHDAPLRLVASSFASVGAIRQGLGDIILSFEADVPGGDASRRLTFENHYQRPIAVYLVNTRPRRPGDSHWTGSRARSIVVPVGLRRWRFHGGCR